MPKFKATYLFGYLVGEQKRRERWYFGGLAATAAGGCIHPMDLIKVHLQTQGQQKLTMWKMATEIVEKDGILGLYNGISATILRQITYSTVRFALYGTIKEKLPSDNFFSKMISAFVSGICGGFVGTPADIVLVRMQNDMKLPPEQRRNYKNAIHGLWTIYKEEGPRKLFSGGSVAVTRAAFVNVGQLSFYDQIKTTMIKFGFPDVTTTHLMSGTLTGILCVFITMPVDVIKTRRMNAKPGEFNSILGVIRHTALEGPRTFYKGLVPAALRMLPVTVLTFIFFEQLRLNFGYIQESQES